MDIVIPSGTSYRLRLRYQAREQRDINSSAYSSTTAYNYHTLAVRALQAITGNLLFVLPGFQFAWSDGAVTDAVRT